MEERDKLAVIESVRSMARWHRVTAEVFSRPDPPAAAESDRLVEELKREWGM